MVRGDQDALSRGWAEVEKGIEPTRREITVRFKGCE